MKGFFEHIRKELSELEEKGLKRHLIPISQKNGTRATIGEKEIILFCTNDYLGLSQHPLLKEAASIAAQKWGVGGVASRLVSGNLEIYEHLERKVAQFKGTEASLTFSSGYAANLGVISTLAKDGDLILSDELNHASIVDACKLSKARVFVYPHSDMDALRRLLRAKKGVNRFVITDGVFSMDGDLAPLPHLVALCKEFEAVLVVDDAHATGVIGPNGKGSFDYWDVSWEGAIQVGTFSKAIGTQGGFVAAKACVIEYMINKARSFIYSTALSPAVIGATIAALQIVRDAGELRHRLLKSSALLRDGLARLGINCPLLPTPIFAIVLGEAKEALALSAHLLDKGIYTPAIRPPTVPQGKSRIRISLSSAHTQPDIEKLLWGIESFFKRGA